MTLDPGAHLEALAAASEAFAGVAASNLDRPVASCPGWDVADLVRHLGQVYGWAVAAVEAGGEAPEAPAGPAPGGREDLSGWFLDRRADLLDALSGRDPQQPAWKRRGGLGSVAWWRRRQALETAVHLFDAETAAGKRATIPAELAADGIDEFLSELLPSYLARTPVPELQGTLHLHATDTDGEWHLDFSAPDLGLRREHSKADTALRGPAASLYLWLWNRPPPEEGEVEVLGDGSAARAWGQVRY
ncbi:MAG TPA: maleylpyruvate isomerase N-terminal domain-containing protein [Acidimicrobiales bacterium]|nr:maleylpyruvate isomerase N-terminal domain-containing protein [Acidimicrobiales bacterium]